jgi:hypothetical protein
LIIESGKTTRLTRQSAIANEKRNQLVTVCNCLSSDIDAQTNILPSVPNIANIDKDKTGQFNLVLLIEIISLVQLDVDNRERF